MLFTQLRFQPVLFDEKSYVVATSILPSLNRQCFEKYHVKKSDSACLTNPNPKEIDVETDKIIKSLRIGKKADPATLTLVVTTITRGLKLRS